MRGKLVEARDDVRFESHACFQRFVDRSGDERLLALTHRVSERQHEEGRPPTHGVPDVHGRVAAAVPVQVRAALPPDLLRWLVALSFFAVAAWALKPDTLDAAPPPATRWGVFGVTVIAFFLAELGDKTQVATIVLAAKYPSLLQVVLGTTLGMLLANVPVVLIGKAASARIPFKTVRIAAAVLFAGLGVYALLAMDGSP